MSRLYDFTMFLFYFVPIAGAWKSYQEIVRIKKMIETGGFDYTLGSMIIVSPLLKAIKGHYFIISINLIITVVLFIRGVSQ